jgi:NAD(P)-dependent dehydrogenase (short-subunit alcohol dehydrogenase family)
MKLQNVNAVITGGSQGLGQAIAEHFVRAGANILICARGEKALATTVAQLEKLAAPGQKILAQACDVSSEAQVAELARVSLKGLGNVQVLVNNAGIYGPKGPTETVDWREWVRSIEINLYGVLLPSRAFIPHLKKARGGKIIILSGGGATNPLPNISSYAAAKAAVVRLMETLAVELKPDRIDVNAIAPGALNTRFLDEVLEGGPEKVGAAFYAKALKQKEGGGVPLEKGARLCVYLASAASDGITGRLISAQWDPWEKLHEHREELAGSDIYTLRRIVPEDRGKNWNPSAK